MRGIWRLLKRELHETFSSPLIYILAALFSALMGWLFYNYLINSQELTELSLSDSVIRPLFGNMNSLFLFVAPLMTMRSFAGETKQNTLSLLLLSKLSDGQIIAAKILAASLATLFILLFTLVFPIIVSFSGFSDWGLIFTSYLGLLLSIVCYLSVGIFFSSLTDNQIIAAISTFCFLIFLMLIVVTANASNNFIVIQLVSYFSIPFHLEGMVGGVVRSYSLVYFFSFIIFFTFLTSKSLDRRRW